VHLRIERAAGEPKPKSRQSVFKRFSPNAIDTVASDTVSMTRDKPRVLRDAKLGRVASISFLQAHPQTIHTLCNLFRHICDVSPNYGALSEQCFWFCDTIMKIIDDEFNGSRFVKAEAWNRAGKYGRLSILTPGGQSMQEIKERFLASRVDREQAQGMSH
jgi:hypothetical protein